MTDNFAHELRTRWMITKTALAERLAYRGDFALGTLMRFLPIITQIFLWWAVFQSLSPSNPESARISGYSFQDMVAYYLLTMLGRVLHGGNRSVRDRFFPMSHLLHDPMARSGNVCLLHYFLAAQFLPRLLPRVLLRTDRLLDARGVLAPVRLHVDAVFPLGTYVPIGSTTRTV